VSAAPTTTTASNRALFALWIPFWLLMLVIAVEDNRDDPGIRWWEPLLWEGSSLLVATGWLLLQRRVSARWNADIGNPWRWFGRHAAWLPIIGITFVPLIYGIRHGVYAFTGEIYEHRPLLDLFFYESIKLLLFAGLWLGIIFGIESFASWQRERERLLAVQKHLAQFQLAQLRAQLQPHFLFNALNTISSLMQVDVDRADRLLSRLADLLRATLQAGERQVTSLRDEVELLRLYASIMEERFTGRISLHWKIDDEALLASIPVMLLQPLLENAFKHGVERSTSPVTIEIAAHRDGESLQVTVRNDGILGDAPGAGIGLRNCRERLAVLYGSQATFELESRRKHGRGEVIARLRLPWQRYLA
jgi:signal transduction histidine kinase